MGSLERFFGIYRIEDWIHYLGFVILGSVIVENFSFVLFIQASFMLAYAYSINDYFEEDFAKRWFLLPLFFSLPLLNLFKPLQILTCFVFILIFTFYSWPKTYLEGKPVASTLSNSLGFLLVFLLPFTTTYQIYSFRYFVILIFLLNTAAQLIHEIAHREIDEKDKKITTAVWTGKNTIWILRAVFILIILTSFSFVPDHFFVFLPTFIYSIYFLHDLDLEISETQRERFKLLGIICGLFYLAQFL